MANENVISVPSEASDPSPTSEAFDPSKALQELVEGQPTQEGGPRLTFHDKCAAFCALQMNVNPIVIMQAFGVSRGTISHLKRAGAPDRNQNRYIDVRREFDRLGDAAFRDRYYTDDIHARLMRIKHQVAQPLDRRGPRGPSRRADKYAFDKYGVFDTKLGPFRIDWLVEALTLNRHEPDKKTTGWFFINCQPDGQRNKLDRYCGAEVNLENSYERQPFLTSSGAHHGCLVYTRDRTPPWEK